LEIVDNDRAAAASVESAVSRRRRDAMKDHIVSRGWGYAVVLMLLAIAPGWGGTALARQEGKTWAIKADYIEACSCNLFCMCYFQTHPEGGRYCEFNMAVKIASGHVGDVKVDGEKYWMSGDLGGDFSVGMKGVVITFDATTPKEKREAIAFLIGKLYPFKFDSVKTDEGPITIQKDGWNGHATLGDRAEITLQGVKDGNGEPSVIQNLQYFGAKKNGGFYLAYSDHRYKGNGYDYTHKHRNGFFINVELSGKD
jgi:hypothetical protein